MREKPMERRRRHSAVAHRVRSYKVGRRLRYPNLFIGLFSLCRSAPSARKAYGAEMPSFCGRAQGALLQSGTGALDVPISLLGSFLSVRAHPVREKPTKRRRATLRSRTGCAPTKWDGRLRYPNLFIGLFSLCRSAPSARKADGAKTPPLCGRAQGALLQKSGAISAWPLPARP